ncbi:hypothetical protein F503_06987 [Ophiostoma piceae UAMH 11346]|uniref:Uncharacterized protein n=1 Tax=Ophiostoma piceae (strain UAMH 11346) TaxID=1262450 RepID=S3CBB4_OPHP1|nr:hypothetical protein F503_06987 [Ophiostoma piceae UAMH 11346]
MRFHPLFPRYVNCPAGSQYYVCSASDYNGCCKVDACHYDDGCPADESVVGTTIGAATTATTATPATTTTAAATTATPAATTTSAEPTTTAATTISAEPTTSTTQEPTSTVQPLTESSTTPTTTPTTATPTSGTSTTADRVSVTTATATATTTFIPAPAASSSKSFPKGAIGGIAAAVVLVVLAIAAFLLFRRRRKQAMQKKDANNGSDERMLSDDSKPGAPTPTMSPMGEKGVFQSPTPMSTASTPAFNGNDGFIKSPVEMYGSPANSAVLFGELDGSEAAIARYGPYGARLKGVVHPAIAELDSTTHSRVELETPLPTPASTPQSTPQIGSNSPNLSLMSGSNGGRSTLVSSWRSSTRTMGTDVIAEEQPSNVSLMGSPTLGSDQEQQFVPLVYDAQGEALPVQQQQQPNEGQGQPAGPVTDSPRSNLDLSQNERGNGVHVASWNAYQ